MNHHYTFFTFESFFENTEDSLNLTDEYRDVFNFLNQLDLEPPADIVENIVSFAVQQAEE